MKLNRNRVGTVTVEMALCLPLLFFLMLGCYELSRANVLLHASQSAAYEGARTGILPGTTQARIEEAVGGVLGPMRIVDFEYETIPAVIENDTESIEVRVRIPVGSNLTLSRMFVPDGAFEGSCRLTREVP